MTNPSDFAASFVAMAKAYEELPSVQAELAEVRKYNEGLSQTIQNLQLRIIDYKNSVDEKQATIRRLEVERDDAELRFLELEDKSHNAIAMAKAAAVSLGQLTGLLDPPKADPIPTPPAELEVVHQDPWPNKWTEPNPAPVPQGQSEANPTSTGSIVVPNTATVDTTQPNAIPTEQLASTAEEVPTSPANPPVVASLEPQSISAPTPNVSSQETVIGEGAGDPLPTSAPPAPTGTGMEQGQLGSDLEPQKYYYGTQIITDAWYAWNERDLDRIKF